MTPLPRDFERYAALRDAAHRKAEACRNEAMDDLWRGANALLTHSVAAAARSAQRLAHRLARLRQLRTGAAGDAAQRV